jgi:glutathione S-transferase
VPAAEPLTEARAMPDTRHRAARPTLWQFRHSHYNEKARWALDWKGVPHVRRSLLPGLHIPRVVWMTGQKSLPVLVLDGRAIADSTRIIAALDERHPAPPLYPADPEERRRALALEEFFDEHLGPHIRRTLFHELLPHTGYAAALLATDFPPLARAAYRAAFPAIRALMRLDMRIDDRGAALGHAKVVAALDRIEAELRPSGYLVGDDFSVADLTAAALLSPLLDAPEYPYAFPPAPPESIARLREALADRAAFRWALDVYRRHRGRSAELPR